MNPDTPPATLPAISTLNEGDPIFARMDEVHQSIVSRAYELFKESGFSNREDLEAWQQTVSELLQQVLLKATETDDEIRVRAEVPGLGEEDIEVKVDPRRVFIFGKQERMTESEKAETAYSERRSMEFLRECLLPSEIDPGRATAELKDGALDIRLPKSVRSVKLLAANSAA
jgi:HSP20 family molecular chaperone IbpA